MTNNYMQDFPSVFLKHKITITVLLILIYGSVNAWIESISTSADFQRLAIEIADWEPFTWSFSSFIVTFFLIFYIAQAELWHPLKYGVFKKHLGFHLLHSIFFSLVHVIVMVIIRKAIYFLYNRNYDFGHWPSELLYEYRKDILTYFFILSGIYIYQMIVKQLQGDISLVTEQHENNSKFSNKILVKKKGKEFIIGLDQVSRIESGGNYVYIHSNNNVYPMRSTMAKMTEKLNNTVFVRIHRSYIVNTDYIKEIITITPQEYQIMMTDGAMIPLSRKNRPLLLARFDS